MLLIAPTFLFFFHEIKKTNNNFRRSNYRLNTRRSRKCVQDSVVDFELCLVYIIQFFASARTFHGNDIQSKFATYSFKKNCILLSLQFSTIIFTVKISGSKQKKYLKQTENVSIVVQTICFHIYKIYTLRCVILVFT